MAGFKQMQTKMLGFVAQGMDGRKKSLFGSLVYAQGFVFGSGRTPAQAVPVRVQAYLIGGGAGGGGGFFAGDGGGGGGAVYAEFFLTPGQTLAYSIGLGGIGATPNPTIGGDTTVTGPTGLRAVAQGGQGRAGGRSTGGKRRYKGGDGGTFAGAGVSLAGAAGPPAGGDGQSGQGGGGGSGGGGGGGGAASPGVPAGVLALTYPPSAGSNGTASGIASTPLNYGGGGGASSDGSAGTSKGAAGAPGMALFVMFEAGS